MVAFVEIIGQASLTLAVNIVLLIVYSSNSNSVVSKMLVEDYSLKKNIKLECCEF